MASTASNKKVARAAKAGGGLSRRQTSTSWGYYGTLLGISFVGVVLIVASVIGARVDTKPPYAASPTRAAKLNAALESATRKNGATSAQAKKAQAAYDDYLKNQHWHSAYGLWDCTQAKGKEWLPLINGEADTDSSGIHAHADGLIHVHPFVNSAAGKRATLGKFFKTTGLNVTSNQITIPAKAPSADGKIPATKARTLKSGTKCTSGKTGEIKVLVYKTPTSTKALEPIGKPKDIPLGNDEILVFALVEDGVTPGIPPTASALAAPSDVVSATETTVPAATPSTTVKASGSSGTVTSTAVAPTSVEPSSGTPSSVAPASVTPTTVTPTTKAK